MSRRFLSAEWHHLVMVNYEVDPAILQPLVPRGVELDAWNGKTFLSLVGFLFQRTRVLGIPIPFHRNFEEVNLRFYVRRQADEGWRRGVVFIKEIVPKVAIAAVARWLYNENYSACPMNSRLQMPVASRNLKGFVEYRWKLGSRENTLRAEFDGVPSYPTPGSQEEFITEHYWGYVRQRNGSALEYRVEHPQWQVWRANATQLDCDIEGCYGPQFHDPLSGQPSSAFVADGSAVSVYRGEPVH